jgi:uncharacterized protein YtpQ (UPF0354 family)
MTTSDQPTPVLDAEQFAAAIEAFLREQDAVTVLSRTGMDVVARIGASELQLNLANFYTTYQQNPAELATLLRTLERSLRSYDGARQITSFDALRDRVYPMLKPLTLLATVRDKKLPMLVYRPFLADLMICYVIDEPSSLAYINEQHIERWQIGEHELHEQALANLRTRTDERGNFTIAGEGAQRLIVANTQDGFDATRLLLVPLLASWRTQFPGTMVIGVPNRDFLIAFSDVDRTILSNVARQVQFDSTEREHGLTDQLFTLVDGQIREYMWE